MIREESSVSKPLRLGPVWHVCGHTFLGAGLGSGSTILDLGANRGDFSRALHAFTGARCVAVEPTPALWNELPTAPGLERLQFAVSGADGVSSLFLSSNSQASGLGQVTMGETRGRVEVETVAITTLLDRVGCQRYDLVKMDIEGAEVASVLAASQQTLARIDQIAIEFHDFCGTISAEDVARVSAHLAQAGFERFQFSRSNMDVLFVNRVNRPISRLFRAWAAGPARLLLYAAKAFGVVRG